ncbi:MAG: phosphatase PAP2 family protein [Proteobacteria bacterium]|nr:phosphatase PAP2 family protein [Pseudomonadota bacterium]
MFDGVCVKHRACGTTVTMKNWIFPLLLTCTGLVAGTLLYMGSADVMAQAFITDYQHPAWSWLTLLGDGTVQVLGCIGMGIFTYLRGQYALSRAWYWAAPLSLVAGVAGQVVKWFFGRPRPKLSPELYDFQWFETTAKLHSFPSGHTLTSFAIVAMVAAFYPKGRWVLLVLAGLAGLSRIFVGAHWPGDVVCGAFLGYALGHVLARLKKLSTYKDLTEQ